ncbi:MAG: tRNA (adenosine(37)-N6)-dimethylallyltransferase MiaA [Patescibacteria group bacterium]|nr:tRNA (adenosine(37)-N6)-dimethylallyltransferase MiaA [Patescibacteria group bacterium]
MNDKLILKQAQDLIRAFLRKPSKLPRVIVILGATATGKTKLSIELAKIFNGEIISADSRQVWRDFNIGTAKPAIEERQGISHHLIDIVDAGSEFTLWDWKNSAEDLISKISKSEKLPIIVGGTGLYIDALIDNFQLPAQDKILRIELEKEWEQDSGKKLLEKLQNMNPDMTDKVCAKSKFHLIRAVEIAMLNSAKKQGQRKFSALLIGLRCPREVRTNRIAERVDKMFSDGLTAEVKVLLKKYGAKNQAMTSIGYREIVSYLSGEIDLAKAREEIIRRTRQYAKRQDTWWQRRNDIVWLDIT